jgi:hypothetical protein
MHRIDGPGSTVDKKFTEGDPVGGVQATVVTAAWMNDVQEELLSVLTAAGITPVKGTQDQLLKAIRSVTTGLAGTAVNAKMTVATASASSTFTADEVVVKSALGGLAWLLSGFSKTINLATTGAGGMDVGTAPANSYVALYAIYNPITGASSILAVNATASAAPLVYGGANMPAGYTASALLTVVPTNASSQFKVCAVRGREVTITLGSFFSFAANITGQNISIATFVPVNAVEIFGELSASCTAVSSVSISVNSDNATALSQQNLSVGISVTGAPYINNFSKVMLTTPQSVGIGASTSAGTPTFNYYVGGYRLP